MAATSRPVYQIIRGSVYTDCPVCHTMCMVSRLGEAQIGRWIEKIVPVPGKGDVWEIKRILTRKKALVCTCCADEYNAKLVHAGAERYSPVLVIKPRGDGAGSAEVIRRG